MPEVATAAAAVIAYVGTASTAVAAGTATAAQIATVIAVNVGMSVAGSLLTKAFSPNVGGGRDPLEWMADTDAPIPFAFGRVGVAGYLVYASDGYGADNRYTSLVSVLSGAGPINSFVGFRSADVPTTIVSDVATDGEHAGAMWLQRLPGDQPSDALASPAGLDGGASIPEWTTSYKLSGKACVMQTLYENSKFTEYQGGEEKPLHIIEGLLVWDPRLDDTYPGGEGDCRLLDPTTWVYSDNPILCGLKWATGLWEGDSGGGDYGVPYACSQVGGIGSSVEGIDVTAFVYAANVSDAHGWAVTAWPTTKDDESQVLDAFLQAGGAERSRVAGKISCVSRAAEQASIVNVSVADTAGPVEVSLGQSRLDRRNTAIARFTSESHGWEMTAVSPVSDAAWVTEDRGVIRSVGIDLPYVPDADQAAQLAYYAVADAREPISGTVPLKPYMRQIKPGDCFTFTAPGLMLDGIKVKCRGRSVDPMTLKVSIDFRQETDAKHDAAAAVTGTTPPTSDPYAPVYVVEGPGMFSATDLDATTVELTWRNPSALNFDHIKIYRAEGSTNFIDAMAIGSDVTGGLGAVMVENDVPGIAGVYCYWLKAFDTDGNDSAPEGPQTATL